MMRQEECVKELEERQKVIPFAPCATSYRMGWKDMQAVHYRRTPASGELSVPPVSLHEIILTVRPPKKMDLRYEGVKRDRPPPAGSITLIPAGSALLTRWQGSWDVVAIYLEPSVVARIAAESFEFDPTQTAVPPLDGLNVPELRSAMLAAAAELRASYGGGPLVAESLATVLSVHLIRLVTGRQPLPVSTDGVLPRRKLHKVVEYIMENLEGSPTLGQMAAVAHLSPYHFARQFKAATGLAPHQYVIARRVERAQHLLGKDDELELAEVALRVGFSDQSKLCFHFKRIVGATPGRFRASAKST